MWQRRSTTLLGAAGICADGRSYADANGNQQLLVADEVTGAWGNAATVKPRTGGIPGPRC